MIMLVHYPPGVALASPTISLGMKMETLRIFAAWSIETGLMVRLNGFCMFLYLIIIERVFPAPSVIDKSASSKFICNTAKQESG